jgi:hypothetical protein
MTDATKSATAIAVGVAAVATLVGLDVAHVEVATSTAGVLGALAGGLIGWLAPSPLGGSSK